MKDRALVRPRAARTLRVAAVLAVGALFGPAAPSGAAPVASRTSDTVVMAVQSVSPLAPVATSKATPLTVVLSLTNMTGRPINKIHILGERGDPISTQAQLDKDLAHPSPPATPGLPIKPTHAVTASLAAGQTLSVTFATTTSVLDDGSAGICLCANPPGIYPLFFSAHVTGKDGVDQRLGVAATYLPSFFTKPALVQVSWLWPLIDRPHRVVDDTVFTDDDLALSVGSDGRLYRALAVVAAVGSSIPLTLVVDPELLDELEVMATGKYTVRTGTTTVPGTGQAAAVAWLDQFRTVLTDDPGVSVELTPYADPDVESLSQHGLGWSTLPPTPTSNDRVTQALAERPQSTDVAWPAAGALSRTTLNTLVTAGASTVVLNSSAVAPAPPAGTVPSGVARLDVQNQDVAAALLSPAIQKYATAAVTLGAAGRAALPALLAEIAIRAAQDASTEHAVIIAPPRYVDASVPDAIQTIRDTSDSPFAGHIALHSVVGTLMPTGRSRLAKVPSSAARMPAETLQAASAVSASLATLQSLLGKDAGDAQTLLASLPVAIQRIESSAWRDDLPSGTAAIGETYAQALENLVNSVSTGVHIVSPSTGVYTLASNNSPLPITVENDLRYSVRVRIKVTTVNGLPGFTAKDIGSQPIEPNSKKTVQLPTTVDRSGRIQVQAELLTPGGDLLGTPVILSVHSTALGAIGVIITIVAGIVLALALLVRLIRRFRKRGRGGTTPKPGAGAGPPTTDPVPSPVPAQEPAP